MNNKVNMTIEVKNGKTYEVTNVIEDRAEVDVRRIYVIESH